MAKTKTKHDIFAENFERVFGSDKDRKERMRLEMEEEDKNRKAMKKAVASAVHGTNFEAFKSPIDGSIINTPSDLRAHNNRNGVTDIRDYGEDWFARRGEQMYNEKIGNTKQAKRERQQICGDTLKYYGLIR